ncbi:uncharacterized protein LOC112572119 [Pomacea canaliculata]|uniref:uncharacterized protein LOC112572119 n=1 Tax=Pomacea canaliculata TaxID=400727 RepID=UPI000D7365B7|nr:uncharacterized protein LOC112572119 [Pomacea canaliculata]
MRSQFTVFMTDTDRSATGARQPEEEVTIVREEESVQRLKAAETCKSRGLVLMTANTPAEWEATRDFLLRYFPDSEFVLYGARQLSYSLSYMYRQVLIGVDGIANYLHTVEYLLQYSDCLGIRIRPGDSDRYYGHMIANCRDNFWSWFACKFPVSPDDTLPQMPVLLTANWSVDVLQCPSLHYTHTFLACDVKSECWADKYDNSKTCSTTLTSRPPSFSCINEIQRVPYSLVCDHRSHCSDDSDEKFCIFPSCPRKKKVFECDNKQVNRTRRRVTPTPVPTTTAAARPTSASILITCVTVGHSVLRETTSCCVTFLVLTRVCVTDWPSIALTGLQLPVT